MTLTDRQSTGDKLMQRMESVRQRLGADVDSVRDSVGRLTDWRQIVRKHPVATAAVAGAIGYVLVPNRRFERVVDTETLERMSGNQRMVLAPKGTVNEQQSVTNQLLALLGAGALRVAGAYLTNRWSERSPNGARKVS